MPFDSEDASRLREAIQRLPAQYRIVLVLRDMEGLTDDEVAEITGLRPGPFGSVCIAPGCLCAKS